MRFQYVSIYNDEVLVILMLAQPLYCLLVFLQTIVAIAPLNTFALFDILTLIFSFVAIFFC